MSEDYGEFPGRDLYIWGVFDDKTYPPKLDKLFLQEAQAHIYAKETYRGKEYTIEELEVIV